MAIVIKMYVSCDWPGCAEILTTGSMVGRINPRSQSGPYATVSPRQARDSAAECGFSRRRLLNGQMGDVCWEHRKVT